MITAEVTNRLDEISVATSTKKFSLKRIFGHSNLQKNKKEDIEVVDKQNLEKVSTPRTFTIDNDLTSAVESIVKPSASTNCAIIIEVPKQSNAAILFSFSNLFSLERKVVLIEEKIDLDDVATSPLHDNEDGSREVYIWSTPSESCFQEYMSSRPEYEYTEAVETDNKSTNQSITQSESTASEDSTAGLTGEIVTSRCFENVIDCGKDKAQDGVQDSKLKCDDSDVSTKNSSSPPKKRTFRKMLRKISNNVKRIMDKSNPSAPNVKTVGDDGSLEENKENEVEITPNLQGENCEEIAAQRASTCIVDASSSFQATGRTPDMKSNSDVSPKVSNFSIQGLADMGLHSK
jgi:hypothetical protein